MRLLNQTLAYCAELEYGQTPAVPDAKKVYVVAEQLGVDTDNSTMQEGAAGYIRGATVKHVLVSGTVDGYLFQNYYHDLIKAALRGRVETSGSGPFTHRIMPATRDYSFVFEREAHGISKNLQYSGCRVGGVDFQFPTQGFLTLRFDIMGLKETESASVLDAVLLEPAGEPYRDSEVTLSIDGAALDAFVSAGVQISSRPEAGRFSTATRKAEEVWQGRVRASATFGFYAEDFSQLGWEADTTLRNLQVRAQRDPCVFEICMEQARVIQIARPFMARGVYRQDVTVEGAGRDAGYPVTIAITNNQASL